MERTRSVICYLERVMGIEPTLSAWEAEVLPLNYTRVQMTVDRGLTTDFKGLLRNALYPFSVDGQDTRIR